MTILTIPPNVVVTVLVVLPLLRFLEPVVLVRSVVDYQVHDQFHSPLVDAINQLLKISHVTEGWINRLIIANVVAIIYLGRLVNRVEPNDVDTQFL